MPIELKKKGANVSTPSGFDDEIEHERMRRERFTIVGFSPDFIQPLASAKFFLFLYVIGSILGGFFTAGWYGNLTSIERRFKMPFAMIGIMRGMAEVGGLVALFVFAHWAGNGHRPRWLGASQMVAVLGAMILVSTELWVPPPTLLPVGRPGRELNTTMMREQMSMSGMCVVGDDLRCPAVDLDAPAKGLGEAADGGFSMTVFITFVFAHALIDGASQGAAIVRLPFLYDNVEPRNFPLYIGTAALFGGAGSAVGMTSMSFFGNIYYRPWDRPPGVHPGDPQWITAWYLPVTVGSVGIFLISLLHMGFPRQLRHVSREEAKAAVLARKQTGDGGEDTGYAQPGTQRVLKRKTRAKQLPRDIWRLLTNPIMMCLAIGRALDFVTAVTGEIKVKYLETQFRVTPARAALYTAIFGMIVAAASSFFGSIAIKRWTPRPRTIMLAIWIAQAITICLVALEAHISTSFDFNTTCSAQCQCRDERFQPVCDHSRNINYFSPCRAGCSKAGRASVDEDGKRRLFYDDCSCIDVDPAFVNGDQIERGWCEGECAEGLLYAIVYAMVVCLTTLPAAGNVMILYLVVEPELKSHAMSMNALAATLLMPGGVFVTVLFDSACALWAGESGACSGGDNAVATNCAIYDTDTLAMRLHYFGVIIKVLGQLSDTYVLYAVWNMAFPTSERNKRNEDEDE